MIPAQESAINSITGASGAEGLVAPFFASSPTHNPLPPAFIGEFHDLGAQVGQGILPGHGFVVPHRGGEANPAVFAMFAAYTPVALIVLLGLTYVIIRVGLTRNWRLARRTRWQLNRHFS